MWTTWSKVRRENNQVNSKVLYILYKYIKKITVLQSRITVTNHNEPEWKDIDNAKLIIFNLVSHSAWTDLFFYIEPFSTKLRIWHIQQVQSTLCTIWEVCLVCVPHAPTPERVHLGTLMPVVRSACWYSTHSLLVHPWFLPLQLGGVDLLVMVPWCNYY